MAATLTGIAVIAIATYLTRLAGHFLGSRIARESATGRVLEVLPGAALAGVLALAVAKLPLADQLAVAFGVGVYLWRRHTLLGIAAGLVVAVARAHLGG